MLYSTCSNLLDIYDEFIMQRNQPTMGVFAVDKLGQSLAPLIGAEESIAKAENSASRTGYVEVAQGWGEDHSKLAGFKEAGLLRVEEVKGDFVSIFMAEYTRLMRLVRSSFPVSASLRNRLLMLCFLRSSDLDSSHPKRAISTSRRPFLTSCNYIHSTIPTLSDYFLNSPSLLILSSYLASSSSSFPPVKSLINSDRQLFKPLNPG